MLYITDKCAIDCKRIKYALIRLSPKKFIHLCPSQTETKCKREREKTFWQRGPRKQKWTKVWCRRWRFRIAPKLQPTRRRSRLRCLSRRKNSGVNDPDIDIDGDDDDDDDDGISGPRANCSLWTFAAYFFATDVSNFCNCEISCKIRQKKDNIWSLLWSTLLAFQESA